MRHQVVSSEEATAIDAPLKKPCHDCPWSRVSVNGWLGLLTPEEWLQAAQSEEQIDCHAHVLKNGQPLQCAGAAIFRKHICKLPRNKALLVLPADRERVFSTPQEFLAHHEGPPSLSDEEE